MIAFVMDAMTFATAFVDKFKEYVWTTYLARDRETLVYHEMANACKECIYDSNELDDFRERLLVACERKLMWV